MKTARLKLAHEDGTHVANIEAAFSDEEIASLRAYATLMTRVREAGLVARGIPQITNIDWQAGSTMKFTCPPFTNGELHELLHVLRPVILQEEPASFQKTMALLGRKFKDKTYASRQKYIRRMFEDGELSMYMQFSVGDRKLLDEYLLRTWLNGMQYHTDKEKAEEWAKLEVALTAENARAIVISQLHSRVKALFILLGDVKLVLGDQDA